MEAILTKYLGPTNHKGSRIKASCFCGSITIPYDCGRDTYANHLEAAKALVTRYWATEYTLVGGSLGRPREGHAFVMGGPRHNAK